MNAETRAEIVRGLQADELAIIDTKGREYTGGAEIGNDLDTLRNFKSVGGRAGLHMLDAWHVYFLKHIDAISTHVVDRVAAASAGRAAKPLSEPIRGRILDARVYLGLLECILNEADEADAPSRPEFNGRPLDADGIVQPRSMVIMLMDQPDWHSGGIRAGCVGKVVRSEAGHYEVDFGHAKYRLQEHGSPVYPRGVVWEKLA